MGQRDAFRESFRDALDGIDVQDLQSSRVPREMPSVLRGVDPKRGAEPTAQPGLTAAQLDEAVARLAARVDAVHLAVQRQREVTDEALRSLTARLFTLVCGGFFALVVVVLLLALLLRR